MCIRVNNRNCMNCKYRVGNICSRDKLFVDEKTLCYWWSWDKKKEQK